jgi:hypothetical protein
VKRLKKRVTLLAEMGRMAEKSTTFHCNESSVMVQQGKIEEFVWKRAECWKKKPKLSTGDQWEPIRK